MANPIKAPKTNIISNFLAIKIPSIARLRASSLEISVLPQNNNIIKIIKAEISKIVFEANLEGG